MCVDVQLQHGAQPSEVTKAGRIPAAVEVIDQLTHLQACPSIYRAQACSDSGGMQQQVRVNG